MKKNPNTIQATVTFEQKYWSVVFENIHDKKIAIAKTIFPQEPSDQEIYNYIQDEFTRLKYTPSQKIKLNIKRPNPKRMRREIKKELLKLKKSTKRETLAQQIVRLDREKNKIINKKISKVEKEKLREEKFAKKQIKKKRKSRGR